MTTEKSKLVYPDVTDIRPTCWRAANFSDVRMCQDISQLVIECHALLPTP